MTTTLITPPPMHLPPLKAVIAFEVVARHTNISKAAEELNLTPSAVSHQIAKLESYVGMKLFERTFRGVTLTPAGERYQQSLAGALALIANAAQSARGEDGIEILRLHCAPSFASLWLMPRLPAFMQSHPDIRLKLSASHMYTDFSRGDVDLDIRYGAMRWADLHVETIFNEEMLPVMSPTLAAQLNLHSPQQLLQQNLIFSEVNLVQWPQWFAMHGSPVSPSQYGLSFDRAYLAIEAAVQGLGIALESNRLSEDFLKRGLLVPVFPDTKGIRVHAHHLVYPSAHGKRSKVARFIKWLLSQVGGR
ncbi:LysR substrate-binding domain-containing protein [Herbaspirillum sp. RTI4]|uniref:LysR substrate-binding domain-containing protein n=1 Tax=Herbaspirillum sp. RTI4 TaxID=3048640 RepID=UPI002AB4FBF6|nr:LysR substrate-binding domain-containing protein [Herbaspirillum sp. RTI4]MDY7579413.1 LysR substrate-binding domain-containing protein [Herbaspirillum sp. RTI4]MEA9980327.1 LysR substrate-binding domain-containing protein [Herbaspirillum sp. RTI4]